MAVALWSVALIVDEETPSGIKGKIHSLRANIICDDVSRFDTFGF